MSSVTSTSVTAGGVQKQADPDVRHRDRPTESGADQGFRPWHFFVLASLMAATAAVIVSRPSTPAHLILISLTIGAAGAAAAGFYRMLAPLVAAGEAAIPGSSAATSERARLALEREKALVLRSIKELEFDRAMGKLSPGDFDEMAARLRARALMLMKQVDEGSAGYRDIIERELSARMAARGARGTTIRSADLQVHSADLQLRSADLQVRSADLQVRESNAGVQIGVCAACGTGNDADASFCKRCGARLAGPPS